MKILTFSYCETFFIEVIFGNLAFYILECSISDYCTCVPLVAHDRCSQRVHTFPHTVLEVSAIQDYGT